MCEALFGEEQRGAVGVVMRSLTSRHLQPPRRCHVGGFPLHTTAKVKKEYSDACGLFCLAVVQVRDKEDKEPSWLRKQHCSGSFKAGNGVFL